MEHKPKFQISNLKNKKYSVITPKGYKIHFGDWWYEHYEDTTGIGWFSWLNHKDKKRRELYWARHEKIKNKNGEYVYKDPESPEYYSYNYLW